MIKLAGCGGILLKSSKGASGIQWVWESMFRSASQKTNAVSFLNFDFIL